MIFVDTGYFLGALVLNDSLRASAAAWSKAIREPFITTEWVLVEVADALKHPHHRAKTRNFVQSLRRNPLYEIVPASSPLFEAGLRLYDARSDKEWSLTDCISFVLMQERGISRALAFDHHFEQAGFEALLWREP